MYYLSAYQFINDTRRGFIQCITKCNTLGLRLARITDDTIRNVAGKFVMKAGNKNWLVAIKKIFYASFKILRFF